MDSKTKNEKNFQDNLNVTKWQHRIKIIATLVLQ